MSNHIVRENQRKMSNHIVKEKARATNNLTDSYLRHFLSFSHENALQRTEGHMCPPLELSWPQGILHQILISPAQESQVFTSSKMGKRKMSNHIVREEKQSDKQPDWQLFATLLVQKHCCSGQIFTNGQ